MNDPLIEAIARERAVLRARMDVLDEMERKLRRTPRPKGVIVTQPHAPKGALREALLRVLRGTRAPKTSAELKAMLRGAGYERPVNGQYFTITLRALVSERLVAKDANGSHSTYLLRR